MNNWLLNPTGKPNSFVEIDLMQEHLNYWIKVGFDKIKNYVANNRLLGLLQSAWFKRILGMARVRGTMR